MTGFRAWICRHYRRSFLRELGDSTPVPSLDDSLRDWHESELVRKLGGADVASSHHGGEYPRPSRSRDLVGLRCRAYELATLLPSGQTPERTSTLSTLPTLPSELQSALQQRWSEMGSRVLITGAAGFVGQYLGPYLVSQGLEVTGVDRPGKAPPTGWSGEWREVDVTQAVRMGEVLADTSPDFIFHLAALVRSRVLDDLLRINVLGTQALLESILACCPRCTVVVAGSAAEYGLANQEELAVSEQSPLRPLGPYGLTKLAQSLLAAQYFHLHGVRVIRTRTFNLVGPGEPSTSVCGAFANQIAAAETGLAPPVLRVGNLLTVRDFVDVRDAVKAYWSAAEKGEAGEVYNVCSGIGTPISELLAILLSASACPIQVVMDPERVQYADTPRQVGDCRKIVSLTGWHPQIPLEWSLLDVLEESRSRSRIPPVSADTVS